MSLDPYAWALRFRCHSCQIAHPRVVTQTERVDPRIKDEKLGSNILICPTCGSVAFAHPRMGRRARPRWWAFWTWFVERWEWNDDHVVRLATKSPSPPHFRLPPGEA